MLYHIKQAAIINWRENYIQFQCVLQLAALGSQHYKAHTRMEGGGTQQKSNSSPSSSYTIYDR